MVLSTLSVLQTVLVTLSVTVDMTVGDSVSVFGLLSLQQTCHICWAEIRIFDYSIPGVRFSGRQWRPKMASGDFNF